MDGERHDDGLHHQHSPAIMNTSHRNHANSGEKTPPRLEESDVYSKDAGSGICQHKDAAVPPPPVCSPGKGSKPLGPSSPPILDRLCDTKPLFSPLSPGTDAKRSSQSTASLEETRSEDFKTSVKSSSREKGGDDNGRGGRRSPLEMLSRVFPHMKREVLQASLDSCQHDILLTMETILNQTHNQTRSLAASFLAGMGPRPPLVPLGGAGLTSAHGTTSLSPSPSFSPKGLLTSPYPNPSLGLNGTGLKSAFSPITQPPTAHLNSIRYTYGSAAVAAAAAAAAAASSRNVTLMPYPPLLPGLTTLGSGYRYDGLPVAAAANKAFHYAAMCSCCTDKSFTHHSPCRDKTTGCIGD